MRRIATIIAVAAFLAAPAPGRSQTGDPVIMNSCALSFDTQNVASQINGLDVQFTNESSKTATVVNVKAVINGQTSIIRDVGTFSPGIEIHHKYKTGGQLALPAMIQTFFGQPSVTCTIASVTFQDGSSWRPDQAAADSSPASSNPYAISLHPASLQFQATGRGNERLLLASGGGSLGVNSDCGSVARVDVLATTQNDVALRVTPEHAGRCTVTVRDGNGNFATAPVSVNP